mmetsp:Transcript_63182/g.179671  ORF Transcript_63182/g.179671 Transcript_63182/m.179671 type:complete len:234 (-) Transcript_63182:228-929(-)
MKRTPSKICRRNAMRRSAASNPNRSFVSFHRATRLEQSTTSVARMMPNQAGWPTSTNNTTTPQVICITALTKWKSFMAFSMTLTRSVPTSCVSGTHAAGEVVAQRLKQQPSDMEFFWTGTPGNAPSTQSSTRGIRLDNRDVHADITRMLNSSPKVCFIQSWHMPSKARTAVKTITSDNARFSTVLITRCNTSGRTPAASRPCSKDIKTDPNMQLLFITNRTIPKDAWGPNLLT